MTFKQLVLLITINNALCLIFAILDGSKFGMMLAGSAQAFILLFWVVVEWTYRRMMRSK